MISENHAHTHTQTRIENLERNRYCFFFFETFEQRIFQSVGVCVCISPNTKIKLIEN